MVGVVLASAWTLQALGEVTDDGQSFMRQACIQGRHAQQHFGFVENRILASAELADPVQVRAQFPPGIVAELGNCRVTERWSGDGLEAAINAGLHAVIDRWKGGGVKFASVVRIAPQEAHRIVSGMWSCLHCVAITGRTDRRQLLDAIELGERALRKFVREVKAAAVVEPGANDNQRPMIQAPRYLEYMHDPSLVVQWLKASTFVKDIKQVALAAESFARIFSRSSGLSHLRLMNEMEKVHPEVLRRARVRLDCVSMLLHRMFYQDMVRSVGVEALNVYVFADASPQWQGLELFAGSFDLFDGTNLVRKLLPMISWNKSFMDAIGKTMALLWQLFLIVGPHN